MIVDVNVTLGRWPFRRVPGDESAAVLAQRLRERGVAQAWACHFDALLHTDLAAVNTRLAEECRAQTLLVPFCAVNPTLPAWRDDVRRCQEVHRMPGLRLYPNYHGYTLGQPVAGELFAEAARRNLIVQVALSMEDERTQHPLLRAPMADAAPLIDLAARHPKLRVILLNLNKALTPERVKAFGGNVSFDLSMIESTGGVARFAAVAGVERVLFGSHAPLFYWEAAALKLMESGFAATDAARVTHGNAEQLLGRR